MRVILPDCADTFIGVRGGMGPPSEELPSETPREYDDIDVNEPFDDALIFKSGIDVNEPFDDTPIFERPAGALRNAENLGP